MCVGVLTGADGGQGVIAVCFGDVFFLPFICLAGMGFKLIMLGVTKKSVSG